MILNVSDINEVVRCTVSDATRMSAAIVYVVFDYTTLLFSEYECE